MFKLYLVLALLLVNINAYATDYYVNSNSSFPETQVATKVYMGDKMLEQKYVYSEQCYTPKKSFTLEKQIDSGVSVCLTSSIQIEKKSGNWVRTIEKGGTMCGSGELSQFRKGMTTFFPKDFYGVVSGDGLTEGKKWSFDIAKKKGKVTIYQDFPLTLKKVIKMTDAEFEQSFTRTENYWNVSLAFEKGVPFCKTKEEMGSQNFYGISRSAYKRLPHDTDTGRVNSVSVNPSAVRVNITANHNLGNSTWNLSEEEFNNSFEETSKVIEVEAGMQRSIEYAGKNGNIVKFIYSEFKDGMARDAFTREFTIDLSGDSVAAYKGAVFEVIKATNSTIEYKVIRNFPVET
jgi:hypothetical protein